MSRFFSIRVAPPYLRRNSLYERKPVTDLWSRLTLIAKQQWKWRNIPNINRDDIFFESQQRILQVHGPPGTGKSSATYRWVYSVCETVSRAQALWINCAEDATNCWTISQDAGLGRVTATPTVLPTGSADAEFADIVVLDGLRRTTVERWRGFINDLARQGVAVILVSSEGVRLHEGDSQDIMKLEHFMPSWVMNEYLAACQSDAFWSSCFSFFEDANQNDTSQRRAQLLDEKYKIAGRSARFMFRHGDNLLKMTINRLALALEGIDSLEAAVRSDRSTGAVNSLIARTCDVANGETPQLLAVFPAAADLEAAASGFADLQVLHEEVDRNESTPRLVSTYATEQVIKRIPTDVVRLHGLATALSNKVIEGYALEQQLKKSLNAAFLARADLQVFINGALAPISVEDLHFCDAADLESKLQDRLQPNAWIFVAGCQRAFDAIHVVSDTHLRFVQCTVGGSHTYYLDIIDAMLRRLLGNSNISWSHIDFMVMRPLSDRDRPFALNTARGSLAQRYFRFDGQQWDRSDYRNNVTYAFLPWDE